MVEMSFKSFFFTPNNFLPKLDLRAMKWVVPTCLLGKPIMKINAVTFITLSKNDYKNPKSRFTGKTFRVIIWGFCVLPGGKKPQTTTKYAPRHHKTSLPPNGSHLNCPFAPEQHIHPWAGYIGTIMYPLHTGVKEHGGNEF